MLSAFCPAYGISAALLLMSSGRRCEAQSAIELCAVLSPQLGTKPPRATAVLTLFMGVPFVNLFNPSLNSTFVLFGLLSILCRVPVGMAGSWKNSSYLQSRSGGDRGSFAKGLLCQAT